MQWGPDADAKLFMHVLKTHDIKLDLHKLALAMGNDVTPKALTHRISKIRSMATDGSTATTSSPTVAGNTPTPVQPAKRAPVKSAAPPTSPAGDGNGKGKGNANKDKKGATAAKKEIPAGGAAGRKRTAAGVVKNGKGKGKASKEGNNAADVRGEGGGEDVDDVDEDEVKKEDSPITGPAAKKIKPTTSTGTAVAEDENAGGMDGDVGVEYA